MTTLNQSGCCPARSGKAENIVRVLVPDVRVESRGYHDILLQNMTTEIAPAVSTADLCELRRFWPQSLLSEMLKCVRIVGGTSLAT